MLYSPYISPASEWVLPAFHGKEGTVDLVPLAPHKDLLSYCDEDVKTYDRTVNSIPTRRTSYSVASNPYICTPKGMGQFTDFLRALIVMGDAERLKREVAAPGRALKHEEVHVWMVWAKDARS